MQGKGGGRKELRFIVGDVSGYIRNKEEIRKSNERVKERGSSSTTKQEGNSDEDEMKGAAGEDKDPAANCKKRKIKLALALLPTRTPSVLLPSYGDVPCDPRPGAEFGRLAEQSPFYRL